MASNKRTVPGKRIGGRGCPACGSHDTEALATAGAQWCVTCHHRWLPCTAGCRGYRLDLRAEEGPAIIGCPDCGVPNRIARMWPEAWRTGMYRLSGKKLEALVE